MRMKKYVDEFEKHVQEAPPPEEPPPPPPEQLSLF